MKKTGNLMLFRKSRNIGDKAKLKQYQMRFKSDIYARIACCYTKMLVYTMMRTELTG